MFVNAILRQEFLQLVKIRLTFDPMYPVYLAGFNLRLIRIIKRASAGYKIRAYERSSATGRGRRR